MPLLRFRRPLPEAIALETSAGQVDVRLRTDARARRYTLRVPPAGGKPVLTMPPHGSLVEAREFLNRQRGWIEARLAARPETIALVPGAVIPLRGVNHRLVKVNRPGRRGSVWLEPASVPTANGAGWDAAHPPAVPEASHDGCRPQPPHMADGGDKLPAIAAAGAPEHFARRITDFLKREARRDLTVAVGVCAGALSLPVPRLRIADQRSRWGSCSSDGTVAFSFRLILAPPEILHYLAAHEVAHLVEANHGPEFWRLVARLDPHYARSRRWLRVEGAKLHAVG